MRFTRQLFVKRGLLITSNGHQFYSRRENYANFQFPSTRKSCHAKINRHYSSDQRSSATSHITVDNYSGDIRRQFTIVLQNIVSDLTEETGRKVHPEVAERFGKILRYNIVGGKKNRVLVLIASFLHLTPKSSQSSENLTLAFVMACCVEMLHVFFLIVDDLQDEAHYRRGKPCWHRLQCNKSMANNDSVMLENGVYITLKKYFHNKPYYSTVLEMFHEMTTKVTMGQCLDTLTTKRFYDTKNLEEFSMNRYKTLVTYKTADYSFYFPIALTMYMAGIIDSELHRQARDLLVEVGVLVQIQDDYLNCFGNLSREDNDIAYGRCTWLIVVAVQKANARQTTILEECYGKADVDKIEAVKNVYKEIRLPEIFTAYEKRMYGHLVGRTKASPNCVPREVILEFLDKIYKKK